LRSLFPQGAFSLFDSPDNPVSPASFDAALRTVGLSLAAVDAVLAGRARAVFVAARPPGHHALAAEAMGFCFFNSVAVAARDLIATHGLSRVLIADFDVHHGNGTQHFFWEDPRVAYLSVHRFPSIRDGSADEAGWGRGRGTTVNVPSAEAGDALFAGICPGARAARGAVPARVRPGQRRLRRPRARPARRHAGVDGRVRWMTRALEDVADAFAGGRIVSFSRGYDADASGLGGRARLRPFGRGRAF
jgi:hypothetical protein